MRGSVAELAGCPHCGTAGHSLVAYRGCGKTAGEAVAYVRVEMGQQEWERDAAVIASHPGGGGV